MSCELFQESRTPARAPSLICLVISFACHSLNELPALSGVLDSHAHSQLHMVSWGQSHQLLVTVWLSCWTPHMRTQSHKWDKVPLMLKHVKETKCALFQLYTTLIVSSMPPWASRTPIYHMDHWWLMRPKRAQLIAMHSSINLSSATLVVLDSPKNSTTVYWLWLYFCICGHCRCVN